MSVPGWWETLLLVAATYRVWRLVAFDTVTDGVRARVFPASKRPGGELVRRWQRWLEFLQCPWCAGFWLSLAAWGAWQLWPHGTMVVAAPLVISMLVGVIPRNLDP